VPAGVTVIEGVRLWSLEKDELPFIGTAGTTGFLPLTASLEALLTGGLVFCVDILSGSDT